MKASKAATETIVFGLGKTGLSVARFLRSIGRECFAVDTRLEPPEAGQFATEFGVDRCALGMLDGSLLESCKQLVISPGVPLDHPFVQTAARAGIEVIGDIELFHRFARAPIIGVTGSNGKSTVVTMVTEMLNAGDYRALSGGNIGVPALSLLDQPRPDYYVLECSSFQLETTVNFAPLVACVLNISADHMDRYDSFEDYARAKSRIYAHAEHVVLVCDDPWLAAAASEIESCTTIGTATTAAERAALDYALVESAAEPYLALPGDRRIALLDLPLRGRHNFLNALAAVAITDRVGLDPAAMRAALRVFSSLPHRTELVIRSGEVDWVDDSKGTNIGATRAAVFGLLGCNNGILIAGGVGKGADFRELRDAIETRVRDLVLFGQDAPALAAALSGAAAIHRAEDLEDAVRIAAELAKPGDTVLFSPACASFDMFRDYHERGQAFQRAVHRVLQR